MGLTPWTAASSYSASEAFPVSRAAPSERCLTKGPGLVLTGSAPALTRCLSVLTTTLTTPQRSRRLRSPPGPSSQSGSGPADSTDTSPDQSRARAELIMYSNLDTILIFSNLYSLQTFWKEKK